MDPFPSLLFACSFAQNPAGPPTSRAPWGPVDPFPSLLFACLCAQGPARPPTSRPPWGPVVSPVGLLVQRTCAVLYMGPWSAVADNHQQVVVAAPSHRRSGSPTAHRRGHAKAHYIIVCRSTRVPCPLSSSPSWDPCLGCPRSVSCVPGQTAQTNILISVNA